MSGLEEAVCLFGNLLGADLHVCMHDSLLQTVRGQIGLQHRVFVIAIDQARQR
jgi:hypothetical protein